MRKDSIPDLDSSAGEAALGEEFRTAGNFEDVQNTEYEVDRSRSDETKGEGGVMHAGY